MRHLALLAAFALALPPAASAQEESQELPASVHQGSDSLEAAQRSERPASDGTAAKRKAQAFLLPLDEQARHATARVAQALETVLAGTGQYQIVDLGRALSVESTPEQAQRAAEGRKLAAEGQRLFDARSFAEAAGRYRGAVNSFDQGLPAVPAHEYSELLLRLGVALKLAGDDKNARESLGAAARLDPEQKLAPRTVDASAEQALLSARADVESGAAGVLEVETRPAGAKVVVDGVLRGASPMRLEAPVGKHLVRLERAGFHPSAELVELQAKRPALHSLTLSPTPGAANLNQVIAGAVDEVTRGVAAQDVARLAAKFALERIILGSVATHGAKVALLLVLVDAPRQKLLGRASLLLTADGTDADQVEADAQEAARKLIAQDGAGGPEAQAQARSAPEPSIPSAAPARAALVESSSAAPALDAAAEPAVRKPVAPAPAPADDGPGLAARDRKPAAAAEAAEKPAPGSSEDNRKAAEKQKAKKKGLQGKTGTEGWREDD